MLWGEIYFRAIGRPWGPAADFIVTVWLGHWRAREVRATRAFKFESGRQRVLRSTIRGPPARAADRPTRRVCLPRAAGLPARAPRALVLSEWEAGVASKKETPSNRHRLDHHHTHTIWESQTAN